MFNKAVELSSKDEALGICSTVACYQNEDERNKTGTISGSFTHGWLVLQSAHKQYRIHWYVTDKSWTRKTVANEVSKLIRHTVAHFNNELRVPTPLIGYIREYSPLFQIDVCESPDTGLAEMIALSGATLIAIHKGKQQRVIDVLREYYSIFPGSFNPPTLAHQEMGKDALWELSIYNADKGLISIQEIMHRVEMINLIGNPVLISKVPTFDMKEKALHDIGYFNEHNYVVGIDTYTRIVDEKYYFHVTTAKEYFKKMNFLVFSKEKVELDHSWFADVSCVVKDLPDGRSTEVRHNCRMELVDARIATYIRSRGLYGFL
jgi:nicotinic acid mononucleotide adenylyltransferase